jgi:phosphoribosyl 1,2-cyclic phosphodiesterase
MAKFFPMFSGSEGNATYIGGVDGGVLVDVGVSYKRIKASLISAEIPLTDIKAVLITHHHNDHIKGLKVFLKNNPVPVVASRETIYALEYMGIISDDYSRVYIDEVGFYDFCSIKVHSVATSHDCKGSSCSTVALGSELKNAVCTDLGIMTEKIKNELGWYPETTFEVGIVKTIEWYLNNQAWVEEVTSGDYQHYYEEMYEKR